MLFGPGQHGDTDSWVAVLFNTLDFLIFFGALYALYLGPARAYRRELLAVGSLFFYGYWNIGVLGLLVSTVAVNFLAARMLQRAADRVGALPETPVAGRPRLWLYAAVVFNLGALGFFKYYNFFVQSLGTLLTQVGLGLPLPVLEILLPVGISFYTFQITAYTVDVSRGTIRAEPSFLNLLLFTTYFPQLVAGPIERAGRLLPLLRQIDGPTAFQIRTGAILACWGVFKKVYVADNLSPYVDAVLVPGAAPPTLGYSLAAVVFAVQIYADFSGYTDIARGLSRMLGIELVLNFNLPFLSSNPAEFWRRWHITLGAFLRDFVYVPLGGNRYGVGRQSFALLVVWTLGGLWHGASLGFLVWGIYCGVIVVLYVLARPAIQAVAARWPLLDRPLLYLGRIYTFLTFAHGLLLFRVESVAHLKAVLLNLSWAGAGSAVVPLNVIAVLLFYMWPLLVMQVAQAFRGQLELIPGLPAWARIGVYAGGLTLFVLFGSFQAEQFFYFQF